MSRLRVLYVDHTAQLSGGELALSRLIPALREAVDPLVVVGEEGPFVDHLEDLGIPVTVVPLSSTTRDVRKERLVNPLIAGRHLRSVLRYALHLRRLITTANVDLVHTNSLKSGFYGCLAARLAGVPSVWHLRDRLAADYLPRPAILAVQTALALLPSRVICNSEATLATLPKRLRARAAVVPSPLSGSDEDGRSPADRRSAVAGIGRGSALTVGMVGRFAPWKGQRESVRAFGRAELPDGSRLLLVGSAMFGEDDYEKEVRAEVGALGLEDRVEFLGHVRDVFAVLRSMDVLVHASTVPEPFGQVLVEGMAAGVPVVATEGGGPSEIVTNGVNGLLYPAGDVDRLVELLERLSGDIELRKRLSDNGLRRARDFTSEAIGPLVVALYEDLTAARRGAA
ncbi:MAG TPA: glycosyltransferase [Streptomyces sp.]|uniref:glycosyltransferase n=1 Tax=Streptomyces sp. TaxID=1931 RepID=UPI002CA5047B|nr:glycosyltransferase [Streptomyces sp.]HWU05308.1 glycosyltransferase [Streptomyces sp.]